MPEPEFERELAPDTKTVSIEALNRSDLQLICDAAHEAGQIALGYFGKNPEVWMKGGTSPVTEADHAADKYLCDILRSARPDYGWLSEETTDNSERLDCQRVFIVDPIDGTRGFISGHKKWCVSVAVVDHGKSVCGVLECPALEETYTALVGEGAWLNGVRIRAGEVAKQQRITGPDRLIEQYAMDIDEEIEKMPFVPSLAYRMAMVAIGELDGTFARANSHDWDIAAADLILGEAGAVLSELNGEAIIYNRKEITHDILVAGAQHIHAKMLNAAQQAPKIITSENKG